MVSAALYSEGEVVVVRWRSSEPLVAPSIPFQLSPERGLAHADTAAHSAFGIGYVFRLLLARFFHKWFGVSPQAAGGFFDTGVKRIAFRPVLVPLWKVDLAMKGRALLEQSELALNISAMNASLPGFRLDPLDRLSLAPPFDTDPVPFDPSTHLAPLSSPNPSPNLPEPLTPTLIPFTRTPLNLLSKLAALPREISSSGEDDASAGLSFDPKQFKPVLFGAYPLYIPLYLGEYEVEEAVFGGEVETRRVTTAVFATTDKTAFSVYPQFLSPPTWLPSGSSVDLSISGRPISQDDVPSPAALQQLRPKLEDALEQLKERVGVSGGDGEGLDPAGITEVIRLGVGGVQSVEAYVEKEGRALAYSEWADLNREYVEAVFEADQAEAFHQQIENLPEHARTVVLNATSLPQVSSRDDLLAMSRKKADQARDKARALRPEWLDAVEKEEQARVESERAQRIKDRGRAGRGRV
ncbi:hypothetical protein JCM10207_007865 [Rhodosporidiobolus poonsookiae]